jgi:hypothetical protein
LNDIWSFSSAERALMATAMWCCVVEVPIIFGGHAFLG